MKLINNIFIIFFLANIACANQPEENISSEKDKLPKHDTTEFSAWTMHYRIGKGVNIGCTFESETEGSWSGYWQDNYPEVIKQKGFTSVRLPVRYHNKVGEAPAYTIDPEWMNRIDQVVNQILDQGLVCILDFHHINSLNENPSQENQDMFVKVWEQLSQHYQDYTENLVFELYNEPHDNMTDEILNDIYKRAYAEIRKTNPERVIIFGGNNWNNTNALVEDLWVPKDDKFVMGTFHRYKPNEFTHQDEEDNVKFMGTKEEIAMAEDGMDKVAAWSDKHNIPVLLGEFGSVEYGGTDSRVRWTKAVVRAAEYYDFSMTYWCFNGCTSAGWNLYNPETNEWEEEIVEVVLE